MSGCHEEMSNARDCHVDPSFTYPEVSLTHTPTFPPINQFTTFLTHMQKIRGRTTMGPPSASRFLAQPAPAVLDVRYAVTKV